MSQQYNRREVITRLHKEIAKGRPIVVRGPASA